jgi:hypothetical protein
MTIAFQDWDLNDPAQREDFLNRNDIAHRATFDALADLGTPVDDVPIYAMGNMQDWLFVHNRRHVQEALLAGVDPPADLQDWDLSDANSQHQWHLAHTLAHESVNEALGL